MVSNTKLLRYIKRLIKEKKEQYWLNKSRNVTLTHICLFLEKGLSPPPPINENKRKTLAAHFHKLNIVIRCDYKKCDDECIHNGLEIKISFHNW